MGIDATIAWFGFGLMIYGIFDLIFFPAYYRNGHKAGRAFIIAAIPMLLMMVIVEGAVRIPQLAWLDSYALPDLMRQIPGFVIFEPSDIQSLYALTIQAYESGNSCYIRTPRKGSNFRYSPDDEITLGKGIKLRDGKDVGIIATGVVMVDAAMEAAELLKAKGINATVIDLHTIRPLDTELIEKTASECGALLVCENGRYAGGIGEMIASHLATVNPVKMSFLNVGDRFGEVGNLKYLAESFGFTADNIARKAEALIK